MSVPATGGRSAADFERASKKTNTYCFARLDRWAGKPSELLRVFLVPREPHGDSRGLRPRGSVTAGLAVRCPCKTNTFPDSTLLESLRHVHVGCRPSSDDIANCGQCMFATSIRKIVGLCADCLHTTTCLHVMFRLSAGSLPSLCGLSSDYLHVLRRLLSYQPGSVLLLVVTGYCRSFS